MKIISRSDKIIFSIIGLLVILVFVFWNDVKSLSGVKTETGKPKKENKEKKNDKKNSEVKDDNNVSQVSILKAWDLPGDLTEISGIAYIDDQRFACIQDELGTIFIYNRSTEKIEKEIPFSGKGDYEGITVKGNTAFVVRADGMLYEVDMNTGKSSAKEYKTPLTVNHNIEGLCYDKNNNRLLLAIKDNEPGTKDYKGIYAFDLLTKQLIKEPVYKINLAHELLNTSGNKKNKTVMPSGIAIHPFSNNIFITDGPSSRLLIMDKAGSINELRELGSEFEQPEGITFSPQGEIFISNEGGKGSGNILKVEMK